MSGGGPWRVDVLGPLRLRDAAGRDVTPTGALQRRLLALFVLRRGDVVSADAAIDALWPADRPRDPVAALQNHVLRLRRVLPADALASVGSGYRLDPSHLEVDADRLQAAVAGNDDSGEVAERLARWRGPAYVDLDDVDEARAEVVRLDDLRLRAREAMAASRLERGDLDGLVTDLSALIDDAPLRERPRALLMAALAASGRTVEALRAYDDFRRLLGDDLGIEPSPALVAQHAALLGAEPPARSPGPWPVPHLPMAPTPLVGRADLLDDVVAMAGTGRVVTLVGPGGVGKTRVLIEVGHRLRARRPERPVVLCELAPADRATAADAVASALGIDARPGVPPGSRIVDVLGTRAVVLLVDNCEHVLDPVAELVEAVVSRCPNATVLATSRERLRVPGERVCVVPTLTGAREAAAVELFLERASAALPGFTPDGDGRAEILSVVRRLDGLPLAIELAASRLHTHELAEVAAGLDRRFTLLSTGSRTSARHSSLAAAVSWSYDLLDDGLRDAFSSLSAFSGPFTTTDAAAICALAPADTQVALAELVERSLVHRAPGGRYLLLETLRAFGAEQLDAAGRAEAIGERHAHRMVEWIEDANQRLSEPGPPVLAEIDDAMPELRAAFGWLLGHGQVDTASRLVSALLYYGILRLRPDVLAWADAVTAADPADRTARAARMWEASAYAVWMTGDVAGCGVRSARAVEIAERPAADRTAMADAAMIQGGYELFEGRLARSADWYRRAIDAAEDPIARLFVRASLLLPLGYAADPDAVTRADAMLREVGDGRTALTAFVWYCAGEVDLAFDLARARQRLARAVEIAEATNASFVRGIAGTSKASIEVRTGDLDVAAADYRWLLEHWRRAGVWSTQWTTLRSVAALLARLGQPGDAAVLEGAVRATAAGHRIFGADERALDELSAHLCAVLGAEAYEAARRDGAALDGDAAVEHALRSLS